jgi:hypothetical protein
MMQDTAVIGSFFDEFAKFETLSVSTALRSLSKDPVSVAEAENLLDFDARLKLLERLAFSRGVPPALMMDLEALLMRARRLHESREGVAGNLASAETDAAVPAIAGAIRTRKPVRARKANYAKLAQLANTVPPASRVEDYVTEAVDLQKALHAIAARLDHYLQPSDDPA